MSNVKSWFNKINCVYDFIYLVLSTLKEVKAEIKYLKPVWIKPKARMGLLTRVTFVLLKCLLFYGKQRECQWHSAHFLTRRLPESSQIPVLYKSVPSFIGLIVRAHVSSFINWPLQVLRWHFCLGKKKSLKCWWKFSCFTFVNLWQYTPCLEYYFISLVILLICLFVKTSLSINMKSRR